MQTNKHSMQKRIALIGHRPAEASMWTSILVRIQADVRLRLIHDYHYNALSPNLARAPQ